MKYPRTLERKLPLMMSGIFVAVFATILVATYSSLTRAARRTAQTSLARATQQLARVAETAIATGALRYRTAAADSTIREALVRATNPASTSNGGAVENSKLSDALGHLRTPTDSGSPIELWSASGRRLVVLGNDRRPAFGTPSDERPHSAESQFEGIDALSTADSLQVGKLFVANGRTRFWSVMPVRASGRVLGYIAKESGISGNPQTERSIRALAGDAVAPYFRNVDGTGWTTLSGRIASAPLSDSGETGRARPEVGQILTDEERIGGTPFVVVMEMPMSAVLAGPRNIVRSLAILSLALLVIGTLASWMIARRITAPLRTITAAAETIARGDYDARVPPAGDIELVRLAESFNDMVREIAQSHEALEKQTVVATSASRAKTDFLATMSHELRTPLNAIGGYVELLEMELRGPVNETQRRDLFRIRAAQQHVLGLISGMLDLSRIEAGRVTYDLQPIELDSFLAGLDGLVAPQAETKAFALEYIPTDPTLGALADREKLRQIILNLLSNAIRHTPSGGRITLDATALGAEHVAIHVRDTGPGIPESKHEAIFEPFVQLDRSLAHPREGVGLGLAISRDLARGMGGELSVRNQLSGGACFTLTLRRVDVTDNAARMAFTGEMPVGLPNRDGHR